jgi:hypothetical protein
MRRLAGRLGIDVAEAAWPSLVRAAGFAEMRARADRIAPDQVGVLKDRAAFFRRGSSGAGREVLTEEELTRYHARAEQLAPPDLRAWLHRDGQRPAAGSGSAAGPEPGPGPAAGPQG